MVGEGVLQTPEERALAATQAYMAFGAETQIGHIPAHELQALADNVEGIQLPTYAAYNAGWLEVETAISTYSENPDGVGSEHYAPLTLLQRAKDRWQAIYLDASKSPLHRARAEVAAGSLEMYETIVSEKTTFNQKPMWERQIATSSVLLRSLDKHRDTSLTHELHCQTLMLLLGKHADLGGMLALPAPARFQDLESERRYDMLLCLYAEEHHKFHPLRIAAQAGGAEEGCIVIHPDRLQNQGYEPRAGHGTLRALLESYQRKKVRMEPVRQKHYKATFLGLYEEIIRQRSTIESLSLGVDALTGMDAARGWYQGLHPNHRLSPNDKPALENCINAHEYALGDDNKSIEDIQRLGWLWTEVASLSEDGAGFDRAIQVFELASETAVEQEIWPAYLESMMGVATVKLYQALHGEQTLSQEQFIAYLSELADIAEGMQRGFAEISENSPHLPELKRIARTLTACMAVNATIDMEHVAAFASHRQRGLGNTWDGSDLLIIPKTKDGFKVSRAGKLRFAATPQNSLDKGIMTLAPSDLATEGWEDDLDLMRIIANEIRWIQHDPEAFEPYILIDQIRAYLLDRAALTMSI